MKGTVKFFHPKRGFGFIRSDENGEEYYFHFTGLVGRSMVDKENSVEFELGPSTNGKGPQAKNIRLVDKR
jgi:CspA family cold shock protein